MQHGKWIEHATRVPWRADVPSFNYLLTSTCWRNDHNGFSHQGPGLIDVMLSKRGTVARIYLPPDANCLLSVADHCFRSRNYVNLIVIDKQPELQEHDLAAARAHCAAGASVWPWASNDDGQPPDVVLACAGDIPTLETLAAADLLRRHVPYLRVRFVNVVDLLALAPADVHEHGLAEAAFDGLFGNAHVVFAFHGYARALHQVLHGRPDPGRFHVRGFIEEGTTTTPFDMVVLNRMSRYHLVLEALARSRRVPEGAPALEDHCRAMLAQHHGYVREHLEDMPEVRDWTWSPA
jgi:xylulose-5-phosphate/fructose-6-phosphate phosphoketolase